MEEFTEKAPDQTDGKTDLEPTPVSLQPWPINGVELYKLKYSDGRSSKDFYNLTWAKEHLRRAYENTKRRSAISSHA